MKGLLLRFKWSLLVLMLHLAIVLVFNAIVEADTLIPSQWNYRGEVRYSGRDFGLWFMFGMNFLLIFLFVFFSYIDPRYKKNKERFDKVLPSLMLLLSIFLVLIHLFTLLWAIEFQVIRQTNLIYFLIGFLFISLGNILPKLPPNFYAGIRTPWTLSSEKNWQKTHRLGGYCFIISGILMLIRGINFNWNGTSSIVHIIITLGICLYPSIYSFILFRKEKQEMKK